MLARRLSTPLHLSRTSRGLASIVAIGACALFVSACASDSTRLAEDRCPVYGRVLPDDAKRAYARGTFLQYRCRFADPAPIAVAAAEPAPMLPPVAAPAPRVAPPSIAIDDLSFEFDSSKLTPNAQANLREASSALSRYPELNASVVGFTDTMGDQSYNQKLSERRAMAARAFLIDAGVAPSRIRASGSGEVNPAASNDSENGRAINRRVEIDVR